MNIDRLALDAAVTKAIVTRGQADALWQFLDEHDRDTPRFRFAHVLFYLGGMVAIGAMSLFMNMGWERYGGSGILIIAVTYFVLALLLTRYLQERGLPIPAGITGTLAVVLIPLAIYGALIGILWQRNETAIEARLRAWLPLPLRELIERRAA